MARSAPLKNGTLYVARHLPSDFSERYAAIESQTATYRAQKQHLRAYKREILLALMLVTLLLLFTTTWVALFLSKQVTVPIQALAEATREISRGNFDHHIEAQAQDELGMLVRSFNRMTEQLGEGRLQINEFTQSLEQAIEERERRRKLMEAILENIPTGVVSLDASGNVARVNTAVVTILGDSARNAHTVAELVGDEASRDVLHMMRRSLRMGAASSEIEIATAGRLVRTAVTVTSLGPRKSNPGFIVVIDCVLRSAAGAENSRLAGDRATNRARNQESADADSAFGGTSEVSRPRGDSESVSGTGGIVGTSLSAPH